MYRYHPRTGATALRLPSRFIVSSSVGVEVSTTSVGNNRISVKGIVGQVRCCQDHSTNHQFYQYMYHSHKRTNILPISGTYLNGYRARITIVPYCAASQMWSMDSTILGTRGNAYAPSLLNCQFVRLGSR